MQNSNKNIVLYLFIEENKITLCRLYSETFRKLCKNIYFYKFAAGNGWRMLFTFLQAAQRHLSGELENFTATLLKILF